MLPLPPISTLFPYTTLFRSSAWANRFRNDKRRSGGCPRRSSVHGCDAKRRRGGRRGCDAVARFGRRVFFAHRARSEEHTSELQSRRDLVCSLLLEKKKLI